MSEVKHQFTPIATVTRREDGRFDVVVDWSDSYQGGYTDDNPDPDHPEGVAACDAIDAWIKTQAKAFIIPAKENR